RRRGRHWWSMPMPRGICLRDRRSRFTTSSRVRGLRMSRREVIQMSASAVYDMFICGDCDRRFLIESTAEVDPHCPYCGQGYISEWKNAFDLSLRIPLIPPSKRVDDGGATNER